MCISLYIYIYIRRHPQSAERMKLHAVDPDNQGPSLKPSSRQPDT